MSMDLRIKPRKLCGTISPPPGKSEAQRLILAAALAEGESRIANVALSEDIKAALSCARTLGADWELTGPETLCIRGNGARRMSPAVFPCGESGAVLRFFLPVSLAISGGGDFYGHGRLMERPLDPYLCAFAALGLAWRRDGNCLSVRGRLAPGEYRLPGNVSSQFFSGLLFALPLLGKPSRLIWTSEPESADYIAMTVDALQRAGIETERLPDGFSMTPMKYRPFTVRVEADWTQAAVWLAMCELGNELCVEGLNEKSLQGDRRVRTFFEQLRGDGDREIVLSQNPDLLPILALIAAKRRGKTVLSGAARLRYKESDRLQTTAAVLRLMGATVLERADALEIEGQASLYGNTEIDCAGDHRIAMLAAAAATSCEKEIILRGADCVNKSYPDFWGEYQRLGGDCHVVKLG